MKEYDKSKPLILIHIPKTAGVTVKEIYKKWYGDNLLFHYSNGITMPEKYELSSLHTAENPTFVYGHFNGAKKFGIEDYYPEVDQFITVLREPFEIAVSGFFYVKKTNPEWRERLNLHEGELEEFIQSWQLGLFDYFPCEITEDNYKKVIEEKFVEVGITKYLDESMIRISKKLKQNYDSGSLQRLNVAKRDQEVSASIKEEFIKKHSLEYKVYNYVLSKYE